MQVDREDRNLVEMFIECTHLQENSKDVTVQTVVRPNSSFPGPTRFEQWRLEPKATNPVQWQEGSAAAVSGCACWIQLNSCWFHFWGGPCSGCWFLVRFSDLILGSQDNGFIQERGVVAGTRVGLVILVPVFLGALVAVFLLSWSFFGRYLGCNSVPGHGLDSCVVVWLSFFVAVLVGPFVAVLVVVLLFAFV